MGKRGLQPLSPASTTGTTKELLAKQHSKNWMQKAEWGERKKRKKEKEVTLILGLWGPHYAKKSAIERRCRGPKCWEANKQTHGSARWEGPGTPANTGINQQARCWERQLFQINEITTSLLYILLLAACRCTPPPSTSHGTATLQPLQDGWCTQFFWARCNVQAGTTITPTLLLEEERKLNWEWERFSWAGRNVGRAALAAASSSSAPYERIYLSLAPNRNLSLPQSCEIANSKHCNLPQALTIATCYVPCQQEESPVTHSPQSSALAFRAPPTQVKTSHALGCCVPWRFPHSTEHQDGICMHQELSNS